MDTSVIFSIEGVGTTLVLSVLGVFVTWIFRRVGIFPSRVPGFLGLSVFSHLNQYAKDHRKIWQQQLEARLGLPPGSFTSNQFLPVHVVDISQDGSEKIRARDRFDYWVVTRRTARTHILYGDAGEGKTTALLWIAWRMSRQRVAILAGASTIPTLLPVGDMRQEVVNLARRKERGTELMREFFAILLARQVVRCICADAELARVEIDFPGLLEASTVTDPELREFRARAALNIDRGVALLEDSRRKVRLFLDAFDEIETYESLDVASNIASVLQQAIADFLRTWGRCVLLVVSSRISHKEYLTLPGVARYRIGEVEKDDICRFAKMLRKHVDPSINLRKLRGQIHDVNRVFGGVLNYRRLYLVDLLRFWEGLDVQSLLNCGSSGDFDVSATLRYRILLSVRNRNLSQNSEKPSQPGSPLDICDRQCNAVRELAITHFDAPLIPPNEVRRLAGKWGVDDASLATFLVSFASKDRRIRHGTSPFSDSERFAFLHTDHRDFWVADALVDSWRHNRVSPPFVRQDFLRVALAHPSVMAFLVESFRAIDAIAERSYRGNVLGTLAQVVDADVDEPRVLPLGDSRWGATVEAAALSIVARFCALDVDPLSTWLKRPVIDRCFQGADLNRVPLEECTFLGCNFSGAKMQGASFRWADLRGSDFDNAELRGTDFRDANLVGCDFTNAAFGCLAAERGSVPSGRGLSKSPRAGKASRFCRAYMRSARFFNIRVTLYGFLNAWAALGVSKNQILIATSLGLVSVIAGGNGWSRSSVRVRRVYFGDRPEALMDVDFHKASCTVICASRDGTVLLGRVCNDHAFVGSGETPRFSEIVSAVATGQQYPRRARLSASGKYIAVGVRDGGVTFHVAENALRSRDSAGERRAEYREHEGPVVAVERVPSVLGDDTFVTAGYDGTVWRWWKGGDGSGDWKRKRLWSVARSSYCKRDIVRSVAIAEEGTLRGWVFIGTESTGVGHGLYAVPLHLSAESPDAMAGQALATLPSAIFALRLTSKADRLFMGLADGRLAYVSISRSDGIATANSLRVVGDSDDDIVRSLILLDEATLASITWMGRVRVYSIGHSGPTELMRLSLMGIPEMQALLKGGRARDRNEICIVKGDEFASVRGLPWAKKDYLNQLECIECK